MMTTAESVEKIKPAEAASRIGEFLILDVRDPAEFQTVSIAGAVLHPLNGLNEEAVKKLATLHSGCLVVCASGVRAGQAAARLSAAGLTPAILEGGMNAWESAGLPVRRSGKPMMSIERQTRLTIGTIIFCAVLLGVFVHPAFLALAAFGGAGLAVSGLTNWCGLALVLARMPWNRTNCTRCPA